MKKLRRLNLIMNFLKYRIRDFLPYVIYEFLSSTLIKSRESLYKEKFKSFGALNPEITFYVIRRRPPGWGFFSNLFYILQGISYAENNNYVPVVDMENYWMGELSSLKEINGQKNAWCYFFNQISDYELTEVYNSKNVILSDASRIHGGTEWITNRNTNLITNPKLLKEVGNIISRHITLNETTSEYITDLKSSLEWSKAGTLGIFIRGSVYFNKLEFLNSAMPSLDYFIFQVKNMIKTNSVSRAYICTEDYRVYDILRRELDFIDIVPNLRFGSELTIEEWEKTQELTKIGGLKKMGYEKTKLYLAECLLLSDCTYFIGTFSNATSFIFATASASNIASWLVISDRTIEIKSSI